LTIAVRIIIVSAMNKPPQPALPPQRVASQVLLGARKELVITHNGREYRLRVTQNGKLILTA
jgi:hemin uptake protein HemP